MDTRLRLAMLPQPDDVTCGPTCLHTLYRFYGDDIPLEKVVRETPQLRRGGTLAVFLACHALRQGYRATIYTYNLHMFDPTWFEPGASKTLPDKLRAQMEVEDKPSRIRQATRGYLEFLERGGKLRFEDLTAGLIQRHLRRGLPILTGLSATYLYRTAREIPDTNAYDDVRGEPSGHFVILCGYDKTTHEVLVGDPLSQNPIADSQFYSVKINRVLGAILLGILTHDANLLIIEPTERDVPLPAPAKPKRVKAKGTKRKGQKTKGAKRGRKHARTHRRKQS